MLQSAKDYELEKIVITSTSEVYGTAKYTPIDENHPKQASNNSKPTESDITEINVLDAEVEENIIIMIQTLEAYPGDEISVPVKVQFPNEISVNSSDLVFTGFSEYIDMTPRSYVNLSKIIFRNVSEEDAVAVPFTGAKIVYDDFTHMEILLTEEQRIKAVEISSEPGGESKAALLIKASGTPSSLIT